MTRSPTWWWSRRTGRRSAGLSRSPSSTPGEPAQPTQTGARSGCAAPGHEFEQLDPAEATYFPGDEDYGNYSDGWEPAVAWPYYATTGPLVPGAPGTPGVPGTITGPVTVGTVPDELPGEDEVFRGDHVHATDGDIGHVLGFVIEAGSGRVTSVLLREGHLLGRRTMFIPRSAVAEVGPDGFRLNITREQVRHLPSADVEHPPAGLQAARDLRPARAARRRRRRDRTGRGGRAVRAGRNGSAPRCR